MADDLDYNLVQEIEDRRDELEYLMGDDGELDDVKINEKLRDEFSDKKYKEALIHLGINEEEDLLEELDDMKNDWLEDDNKEEKDKLMSILLKPERHIRNVELRLMGGEVDNGKIIKKPGSCNLIPTDDIRDIISFLESVFLPQNLMSKLRDGTNDFISTLNIRVNGIRERLANYPDHIVSAEELERVIHLILPDVQIIQNASKNGRLGDLVAQILTNSYSEKSEDKSNNELKDKLSKLI